MIVEVDAVGYPNGRSKGTPLVKSGLRKRAHATSEVGGRC